MHLECAIEQNNLTVLWYDDDDDDDDDCCYGVVPGGGFGGGATRFEGYECLVFSNIECCTIFPKDLLSDYSASV